MTNGYPNAYGHRVAAVRPSDEFEADWDVVDTRSGKMVAVKYGSEHFSALGCAEALASELNAAFPPGSAPEHWELCEKARELRIVGAVV
jgi:hypothetical protein